MKKVEWMWEGKKKGREKQGERERGKNRRRKIRREGKGTKEMINDALKT